MKSPRRGARCRTGWLVSADDTTSSLLNSSTLNKDWLFTRKHREGLWHSGCSSLRDVWLGFLGGLQLNSCLFCAEGQCPTIHMKQGRVTAYIATQHFSNVRTRVLFTKAEPFDNATVGCRPRAP